MFDVFIKYDGIEGESTDDKHKGWIEVLSHHHEMRQPTSATVSSQGGATSERVDMGDFTIVKGLDKASPKLYEACCKGTHIPTVTIEMCRAGGDKLKYMEVKLEQVIVSYVNHDSHSKGTDGIPTETISHNFGKITWTYTQQKRSDGTGGGNVAAVWNLIANKASA